VQRLLRALRKKAAENLMAEMTLATPTSAVLLPGAVDGAAQGCLVFVQASSALQAVMKRKIRGLPVVTEQCGSVGAADGAVRTKVGGWSHMLPSFLNRSSRRLTTLSANRSGAGDFFS